MLKLKYLTFQLQIMKAINMTSIIKKYPGYFVAISDDRKKVFGKGHSAKDALNEAKKNGFKNPLIARIPEDNSSYLL